MTGDSLMVTLKEQVDVWLAPSIEVHVTGVVPVANELPLAGVHVTTGVVQLSVAVGAE